MSESSVARPAEKSPYEIIDIADQSKRGWELQVNGETVPDVSSATLTNASMGLELKYGQTPQGYDAWKFHEPGGGGSVTMPWAVIDGKILLGVVNQNRPAAGGVMSEAPRGFMDPGESHLEAAVRETSEETGLQALKERFVMLGNGKNPNTTFFDTSGQGEGVTFFGLQVMPDELEQINQEDGASYYAFRHDIRAQATGDKVAERILGSRFIPIQEAVTSPDLMTAAGAGLLTGYMLGSSALRLAGVEYDQ